MLLRVGCCGLTCRQGPLAALAPARRPALRHQPQLHVALRSQRNLGSQPLGIVRLCFRSLGRLNSWDASRGVLNMAARDYRLMILPLLKIVTAGFLGTGLGVSGSVTGIDGRASTITGRVEIVARWISGPPNIRQHASASFGHTELTSISCTLLHLASGSAPTRRH